MKETVVELFKLRFGLDPDRVEFVGAHASNRQIFRLYGRGGSIIGVVSPDIMENQAFLELSRHFRRHSLPVPEILADDPTHYAYLEEDLGDTTLLELLHRTRSADTPFPAEVEALYRQALDYLVRFQIDASADLDYGVCYPKAKYDRDSMIWDMHYFRDQFLSRAAIQHDAKRLEQEFALLTDRLMQADRNYFVYRDFQARNIMVRDGKVYFIDYQGGRQGPLHYDPASLLYQSTAKIPDDARRRLLDHYLNELSTRLPVDRDQFLRTFEFYVLVRLLQVLGAYGRKGLGEGKQYFRDSIPHALEAIREFMAKTDLPMQFPELATIVAALSQGDAQMLSAGLVVNLSSFSYKQGLPASSEGHGGGYVFDCRCLPNPGREERYRTLTGRDAEVVEYLRGCAEVGQFFERCMALLEQSVDKFIQRGFNSLTVCFGCTGGRHRSVYLAELAAQRLGEMHGVRVSLQHRDLGVDELERAG